VSYTAGDVERLTRVKPHVLRYWEKEVALIQPQKDNMGHLHYSDRDLQLFLRLKYLVQERHFTLEGAREELFMELTGKDPYGNTASDEILHFRSIIAALRSELIDLYLTRRKRESNGTAT
jgi:DNA-binding transcriptional MerR regulator